MERILGKPMWSAVTSPAGATASAAAYPSPASNDEIESMRSTIRQLEDQLDKATELAARVRAESNIETSLSGLSGEFHSIHSVSGPNQPGGASRSVWHKTRLFGQSHWVNGIVAVRCVFDLIEPHIKDSAPGLMAKIHKTKVLARQIKSTYMPEWPTPPTSELPNRTLADELVHNYFKSYESLYRVLHAPTFRVKYEAVWSGGAERDEAFVILLKLVIAIGTALYDPPSDVRSSAARWTYEAQTWLAKPNSKSRLGLQYIQTHMLCLFAREVTGIGEDVLWTNAGSLYRLGMHMGLHRDPARLPKGTPYDSEMRRRLWNTILEISLRSSMISGGPPLMILDDFDTEPPGNFDDEELRQDEPCAKPLSEYSQTTIALALRHTFPIRLKIAKFLNDIRSVNTYDETLRLDTEYRAVYKELRQFLQACGSGDGDHPTDFQLRALDFIVSHYLLALHIPAYTASFHDKTYAYSRTVLVDTAYKLWAAGGSDNPAAGTTSQPDTNLLVRLVSSTSGYFRIIVNQASLALVLEIRQSQQLSDSIGPAALRRDVAVLLEDIRAWQLHFIEVGEPSVRGYMMICILIAHIEGLARGLPKHELGKTVARVGEAALDHCIPILEKTLAMYSPAGGEVVANPADLGFADGGAGWEFLTNDAWFDFSNFEPVSEAPLYGPW